MQYALLAVRAREKELHDYIGHHPGDVTGYAKLARQNGASIIRVNAPGLGIYNASPEAYEQARRQALSHSIVSTKRASLSPASGVPANAFTVTGMLTYYPPDDVGSTIVPERWSVWGEMDVNTQSTYIGAGNPNDVSALAAQGASCWNHTDDSSQAYWTGTDGTYHDVSDSATYLNSVAAASATWKIQDESHLDTGWIPQVVVSGWMYWPPSNAVYAPSSCRTKQFSVKYYYDHNQGGGTVSTIGVSIGGLTIGYTGGTPPELQKTTGLMYSYMPGN